MLRTIVSFDLDNDGHWQALLVCGHYQHVRHDPPLISRPWVLTAEGRAARVGLELDCIRCDGKIDLPESTAKFAANTT